MKSMLKKSIMFWISAIILFILTISEAKASHSQGTDITYQCLGGNQYRLNLSFYRDCAGIAAPTTATVTISSISCGQSFTVDLNKINGTGQEVTPICPSLTTQCNGGSYPGVQEYIYTGVITLPAQCTDWKFGFSLCCRNAAITTINQPGSENIYVESTLDNLNFSCNNSPTFLNKPIPFVCVGQPYCYNNGANDVDGDSIYYRLITPKTGANTTVTYNAPYSAAQPLSSTPAVTFNNTRGDMCMTPNLLEVTVLAIIVEEWRNQKMIGSVMRDIQLKTVTCNNSSPYVNGINNTGVYDLTSCAGKQISFTIPTFDPDANQNVTITWDNGIPAGTFTSSGGSRPTGTFTWTPTAANISANPYCFTVKVKDDNCVYYANQIFSFCITVIGYTTTTTSTNANCGNANGTASVQVSAGGVPPYTYSWAPSGGNASTATGLAAGTYTVTVTPAQGCPRIDSVVVGANGGPLNVNLTSNNILCFGSNTGSITAIASGAQQPYNYSWSNGPTTPTITGLSAGTYTVTVTSNNGCTATVAAIVGQPALPLSGTTSQINATCNGASTGSASIVPSGGTAPYSYLWNTNPAQTTDSISNLPAGNYTVTITDANGCTYSTTVSITQPSPMQIAPFVVSNVTCNGLGNGVASVGVSGGTAPYTYQWNTNPVQTTQTVTGLPPGNYSVIVTDANNCSATSNIISITQPDVLIVNATGTNITCHGLANGQATSTANGGTPNYTYQWLPSGGTSSSVSGLAPGTYTVVVTDNNGCTNTANVSITQPAPIVVTASGSTTICLGQNATISANASGGTGAFTYTWNGTLSGQSQTVSPTAPTSYFVVVTDVNGCTGTAAAVVINVTSLTAANLTVSPGAQICAGGSATIFSSVTGNTGTVTVNWNNGLGAGNGPFIVSPPTSTVYTVTVTDVCNNTVTASVPIIVNPLPIINISPVTGIACEQVSVSFVDSSTSNTGAQYLWTFGDGGISTQNNPTHTYTNSGIYNVKVIVTSNAGCVDSANTTATITVHPGSEAKFRSEAMDGTTLSPIYKFFDMSVNAATYVWDFGDGNKNSTDRNPIHKYADKGEYIVSLTTTSINGCPGYYETKVIITPEFIIYIPNAFTPDGDGTNDVFIPKGMEINEFAMEIYSRWGQMIYRTDDLKKGWDGRANYGSDVAQQDVYVYKIQVKDENNKTHHFTGHVTLLKNKVE